MSLGVFAFLELCDMSAGVAWLVLEFRLLSERVFDGAPFKNNALTQRCLLYNLS